MWLDTDRGKETDLDHNHVHNGKYDHDEGGVDSRGHRDGAQLCASRRHGAAGGEQRVLSLGWALEYRM
jgi:hypothetical protein